MKAGFYSCIFNESVATNNLAVANVAKWFNSYKSAENHSDKLHCKKGQEKRIVFLAEADTAHPIG